MNKVIRCFWRKKIMFKTCDREECLPKCLCKAIIEELFVTFHYFSGRKKKICQKNKLSKNTIFSSFFPSNL